MEESSKTAKNYWKVRKPLFHMLIKCYIFSRDKENALKAKFLKLKEQLTVVVRLFVIMGKLFNFCA